MFLVTKINNWFFWHQFAHRAQHREASNARVKHANGVFCLEHAGNDKTKGGKRKAKNGENIAIDKLNLEVRAGEVFGYLGHNGAGKTTIVRLLNGVLEAHSGNIRALGLDPINDGPALRAHTGVLTESASLDTRLTARDNLCIYADLFGVPRDSVPARILGH